MSTQTVFNVAKTADDYIAADGLFLGQEPGVFDTINTRYPKIWELYKEMKSLDWDEREFKYAQCLLEFEKCDPGVRHFMISTLAYQWEADSVASRAIAPVLAPFITNSELWAAWQRISDNEVVHGATYSEIVRLSFTDPKAVLSSVLEISETYHRMDMVNKALSEMQKASYLYGAKMIPADDNLRKIIWRGVFALWVLERVQFAASFAVTFTITHTKQFQPIGKAVQKIATDELKVHAKLDEMVLKIERELRPDLFAEIIPELREMLREGIESEFAWVGYLYSKGYTLLGTSPEKLRQWVLFNAKPINDVLQLGLEADYEFPDTNPMPFLADWLDIDAIQPAPQEEDQANYKVNVVHDDADGETFDF